MLSMVVFSAPAIGILCLLVLAALSYFYLTQNQTTRNRVDPLPVARVPEAVQPHLIDQDGDAGGLREEAVDGALGGGDHDRVEVLALLEQEL